MEAIDVLSLSNGYNAQLRHAFLPTPDKKHRYKNTRCHRKCSSPTRACSGRRFASSEIVVFQVPVSATMWLPSIGDGAAKAQPVGRVSFRRLSRSRRSLSVFLAKERLAVTKERIERGMNARCAAWFRVALSQPLVVRTLVMLCVIPVNVQSNSAWYERSWCCVWFQSRLSQPRVVQKLVMRRWFRAT